MTAQSATPNSGRRTHPRIIQGTPPVHIDATPVLPLLAKVDAVQARLTAADAEWFALDDSVKTIRAQEYTRREIDDRAALDEATEDLMAALRKQVQAA